MEKLLNIAAGVLAEAAFSSAVSGAEAASSRGMYQAKPPKILQK